MLFLIPWRVDVPQDRWPVANWLILLALVGVFTLQIAEAVARYDDRQHVPTQDARPLHPRTTARGQPPTESTPAPAQQDSPDFTDHLVLRGWSLRGLFGYMWLHGSLLHLLGNMLFLWVFGNAVCAKIGNLRYLALYLFFGVAAGVVHLLAARGPVVGASGAINGVVGMFLVLFFENEVTCVFAFWLILPYIRVFAVSSIWMILFWLGWDVIGALLPGHSGTAYFAHFGGFGAGFGLALLMCWKGWITMERYEKSLLQMWQERRQGRPQESLETAYARLGLHLTPEERQAAEASGTRTDRIEERGTPTRPTTFDLEQPTERVLQLQPPADGGDPPPEFPPIPSPPVESQPSPVQPKTGGFIRTACGCGHVLRVTRQYAGRAVRCPNCRQPVVIPPQTDHFDPAPPPALGTALLSKAGDGLLRFLCPCGRRIKVPAACAGHTCRCPQCGTKLRIPAGPS